MWSIFHKVVTVNDRSGRYWIKWVRVAPLWSFEWSMCSSIACWCKRCGVMQPIMSSNHLSSVLMLVLGDLSPFSNAFLIRVSISQSKSFIPSSFFLEVTCLELFSDKGMNLY